MSAPSPCIVLVDNTISRIFKVINSLRAMYPGLHVFDEETKLLAFLETETPDVILLQLDLAPTDAINLMKEIKALQKGTRSYIVIYTDTLDDFVLELGLNEGADAMISFHQKESVLRLFLKNLIKRRLVQQPVNKKDIVLDSDKYVIYKDGIPLQLPRKEFRLFEILYNNSEKFFSKQEIAKEIWNDEAVARKRTIDVHIYNIRQIFGRRIIQSRKGLGYRINRKLTGQSW